MLNHNHFVKGSQIADLVNYQDLSPWTERVKTIRSLSATSNTGSRTSDSYLWVPEFLIKFSSHNINSMYCNKFYFTFTLKFTINSSDNFHTSMYWKIQPPCMHCCQSSKLYRHIPCMGTPSTPTKSSSEDRGGWGGLWPPAGLHRRLVAGTPPMFTQATNLAGFERATMVSKDYVYVHQEKAFPWMMTPYISSQATHVVRR